MCTGTDLHADQTLWQLREERQKFRAMESFANHDLAVLIGDMNTEHGFHQIDADGCNIHDDSPCF